MVDLAIGDLDGDGFADVISGGIEGINWQSLQNPGGPKPIIDQRFAVIRIHSAEARVDRLESLPEVPLWIVHGALFRSAGQWVIDRRVSWLRG